MRSTSENTSSYHNNESTHGTIVQSKLSSSTSASVADVYENGQNNINALKLKWVLHYLCNYIKKYQNIILTNVICWYLKIILIQWLKYFIFCSCLNILLIYLWLPLAPLQLIWNSYEHYSDEIKKKKMCPLLPYYYYYYYIIILYYITILLLLYLLLPYYYSLIT